MKVFEIDSDYIQLNQLLKVLNWVNDGAHANFVIDEGLVTVNGIKELRRRNKIVDGFIVEFEGREVKVVEKDKSG